MNKIVHKIWHLNWNTYQRLKPFLLILLGIMTLITLMPFGLKFVIQIVIVLWILCLAFYDFLLENTE